MELTCKPSLTPSEMLFGIFGIFCVQPLLGWPNPSLDLPPLPLCAHTHTPQTLYSNETELLVLCRYVQLALDFMTRNTPSPLFLYF